MSRPRSGSLQYYVTFAVQKNEKVKFQLYLKDNTNVELPPKQKNLKMAFSGKITTISCRIGVSYCFLSFLI